MNWSTVVIARNEEKTLPRLIASLSEFLKRGGDFVVLDTGSTDKTAEVARSLGCRVEEVGDRFRREISIEEAIKINDLFAADTEEDIVVPYDKLFDFSAARNYAASLAKNDMVSMPDCDEVFTKIDLDKVNELIASGVTQLEYNFVFSHDAHGNEAIKFMHSKFYDRTKAKWVRIVHEVLEGNTQRRWVGEDVIKLEHFQNQETNRGGYLKGLALDCFLDRNSDRNSHYLGRELLWSGRPLSAIRELKRHIDMNAWQPERSQSAILIGEAYHQLGNIENVVYWWNKAYFIESGRREPFIRLGSYYAEAADPVRTIAYMTAALTIPPNNFYGNDQAHYTYYPHDILAWAYGQLGDKRLQKDHEAIAYSFRLKK